MSSPDAHPADTTRLHITPLTPSLFQAIIPRILLRVAKNISYHSIQTFPEKSYGFVELPTMEARKIQKKLNGSTLKGQKIRIEEAKPERRRRSEADGAIKGEGNREQDGSETHSGAGNGVSRKRKRDEGVVTGYELPNGRHVRRGWTEPATESRKKTDKKEKKRKAQPSKYTKEPEMLFHTVAPATAHYTLATDGKSSSKRIKDRETTVHEFAQTTKHATFLRDGHSAQGTKRVAEYVDGKGWVDEQGEVVEPAVNTSRKRKEDEADENGRALPATAAKEKQTRRMSEPMKSRKANAARVASMVSQEEVGDDLSGRTAAEFPASKAPGSVKAESTSASDEDAHSSSSESSAAPSSEEAADEGTPSVTSSTPSSTESTAAEDSIKEPESNATTSTNAVPGPLQKPIHPLEALYKRPQPDKAATLAPIRTSFNFFDSDPEDVVDDEATPKNPPQTPFTRQDLRTRTIRSAAPTPDTAAPGKKFKLPWSKDEDDDSDDEALAENGIVAGRDGHGEQTGTDGRMADRVSEDRKRNGVAGAAAEVNGTGAKVESEFAKWFWEHRGDLNRAWKRRRREALKQQRQRENRRLGRRIL